MISVWDGLSYPTVESERIPHGLNIISFITGDRFTIRRTSMVFRLKSIKRNGSLQMSCYFLRDAGYDIESENVAMIDKE
jgi:hypothetical protein